MTYHIIPVYNIPSTWAHVIDFPLSPKHAMLRGGEKFAFCIGAVSTLHVKVKGGPVVSFLYDVVHSWRVLFSLRNFFRHPVWWVIGSIHIYTYIYIYDFAMCLPPWHPLKDVPIYWVLLEIREMVPLKDVRILVVLLERREMAPLKDVRILAVLLERRRIV